MIAFWVGMFAVVMLFLMCVSPTPKWNGKNLSTPPAGEVKPPNAHLGDCYSGERLSSPSTLPKAGSGQSK